MFILVFILILAVLVFVHELGHFIMAKRAGMLVEEFGLGFPPRLFSFKKGETTYSLNLVPLGGFVRILGENNEGHQDPRSFINKGFFKRFFTLVAGVVMNVILAWVLLTIGFMIGVPSEVIQNQSLPAQAIVSNRGIAIVQVQAGSPAEKAGIKEGDALSSVDGQTFQDIAPLINYVKAQAGHSVDIKLQRGSEAIEVHPIIRVNPPKDQGALGVAFDTVGLIRFPWYVAPWYGLKSTWFLLQGTVSGFYHIIVKHQGLDALGGPVKIATLTNQVTKLGIRYILNFAAILSINLAIINILPFPALDGGRVLFLIIEFVRGKRNDPRTEQMANAIGFGLLIVLIIFISIRDVLSLIGK